MWMIQVSDFYILLFMINQKEYIMKKSLIGLSVLSLCFMGIAHAADPGSDTAQQENPVTQLQGGDAEEIGLDCFSECDISEKGAGKKSNKSEEGKSKKEQRKFMIECIKNVNASVLTFNRVGTKKENAIEMQEVGLGDVYSLERTAPTTPDHFKIHADASLFKIFEAVAGLMLVTGQSSDGSCILPVSKRQQAVGLLVYGDRVECVFPGNIDLQPIIASNPTPSSQLRSRGLLGVLSRLGSRDNSSSSSSSAPGLGQPDKKDKKERSSVLSLADNDGVGGAS